MASHPKSMLEHAFELLVSKKKPVSFKDIWHYVEKKVDVASDQQMGRFYKDLTLDGRFVALGGNMWDLKTNYTFKQLFDDARGVFRDVEEGEEAVEAEDPFEDDDDEDDEEETGSKSKKKKDESEDE